MNRIRKGIVIGSIALIMTGCGDGAGGGGGTCNYKLSDVHGCYEGQTENTAYDWYCFDGSGRWREDGWNKMSGCVASVHTGTYEFKGCTMKSVRDDGQVANFAFKKDNQGNIYIDNTRYKWASDLNGYCEIP